MDTDIEFRYFIAVVCQSNNTKNSANTLIIRRWETHMTPRLIRKNSTYLLNNISLMICVWQVGYQKHKCMEIYIKYINVHLIIIKNIK